ncbi:MAG: hypothetical protein IKW92_09955 [Firmicutes bacterium]|nr:hypothetical protein [Bacillota bacterium]
MFLDHYWQKELYRHKIKLQFWLHTGGKLLRNLIEHSISREVLYSATIIRKLIENEKEARTISRKNQWHEPPLQIMRYRVPVLKYPFIGDEEWIYYNMAVEDYDYEKAEEIKLDLEKLCNKIIHSYIWTIVYSHGKVYGIAVASDREKAKEIYLLKLADWIEVIGFCSEHASV